MFSNSTVTRGNVTSFLSIVLFCVTRHLKNVLSQQEINNLYIWFQKVDADKSGTIDANELSKVQFTGKPLGKGAAIKLIRAFDKNGDTQIDFSEYVLLHGFIVKMQNSFTASDVNKSGGLDFNELQNALRNAGFPLSPQAAKESYDHFELPNAKFGSAKGVPMNGFLLVCAYLATVRNIFEYNDSDRDGKITLTFDQFAHITVHLMDKQPYGN